MYVIKHIDYLEVEGNIPDFYQYLHEQKHDQFIEVGTPDGPQHMTVEAVLECVRGRKFTRPDGTDIIIGNAAGPAEIIGIQYEAWETVDKFNRELFEENFNLRKTITKLNTELNAHSTASFWKRLKWLFSGVD